MFLPYDTGETVLIGPFVDDTDGKTAETGLAGSMTVYLSKAGAASAARNSTDGITHDRDGWYLVPLNDADFDTYGRLDLIVNASGALPVFARFYVIDPDIIFGLENGLFAADLVHVNGDYVPAGNLAAMFDGTGYDASASIVGADVQAIDSDPTAAANANAAFDGSTGFSFPNSLIQVDVVKLHGSATASANLSAANEAVVRGAVASGTITADTFPTGITGYGDGTLRGRWLFFNSGARRGTGQEIATYVSSGGVITLGDSLPGAPSVGDTFVIV